MSGLGLFTVLLGAFLSIADYFIVNVALPTIGTELHASPVTLEMVVAGYGLSYALLLVIGGRLGDAFGRRRLFLAGIAAFTVTSLICGVAPDAVTLVVARILQGASAALMVPQVLATIQAATTLQRRSRAIGLYGVTGGIAGVIGQLAGGLLIAANVAGTGWRLIFLVNVPIGLVALLLALKTTPATQSHDPAKVDVRGTILLGLAVLSLLVPLTVGRTLGWPIWTFGLLAAFPVIAVAFVLFERKLEKSGRLPLVPPSLMRVPSMRRGLLLAVPFFTGFGGLMFCFAVAMQSDLRMSPLEAGLTYVPLSIAYLFSSLSAARLVDRFGRTVLTVGSAGTVVGYVIILITALSSWSSLSPLTLAPGMVILGFGQGLVMTPLFRLVLSDVPADRAGAGSGVLITTQQTSLALGVALLGGIFLSLTGVGGPAGRTAFAVVMVAELVVTVVVGIGSRWLPNPAGRSGRVIVTD
ncbi:MFS transporter [Fodinicola feengrottensis]